MKDLTREFEKISSLDPRRRGIRFEQLFYDIFEDHEILEDRSFKTNDGSEQIDGSVEINNRIFIVETKWEKTGTLARKKLLEFIGKINSKMTTTLGIFISYNTLSENTIRTAREGIRQNCIIIHGKENIMPIIRGEVSVADYAWYIFKQASTRNKVTAPISEFLRSGKKSIIRDKWNEVRDALLSKKDNGEFEEKLDRHFHQIKDLPERAIIIYPKLKERGLRDKIIYLLDAIIDEENYRERLYDALVAKLRKSQWIKYAHEDILSRAKDLSDLDEITADKIADRAMKYLRDREGNYDDENDASRVLDFIYDHLSDEYEAKLACAYATIYCDNFRRDRYEQKQMANKIFWNFKKEDRWFIILDEVKKFIKENKPKNTFRLDPAKHKEDVIDDVYRKFERIINESDPQNLERQLNKIYDKA